MSKGKYTTYVPPASPKNAFLRKLFNAKAGDQAIFYGTLDQSDNIAASAAAVARGTAKVVNGVGGVFPSDGIQQGDLGMFPTGVRLDFSDSPNLADVKWNVPGDPANPYVPDITSPGPGKTEGLDKNEDPQIAISDLKDNYVPGAPGTTTTSPSTTSPNVGSPPIDKDLTLGKSPS